MGRIGSKCAYLPQDEFEKSDMDENVLEIYGLSKRYPGVTALDSVNLNVRYNTVHCVVGENGAGKSTLIKILTGAEKKSGGKILFRGRDFNPRSVREAMDLGISVLFQELNIVDQLTVGENLILGREPHRYGILKKCDLSDRVFQLFREFAPEISLEKKVGLLSFAEKQIIEIVRAIAAEASLLIMDEPTAAVSEYEVRRLFSIILSLKQKGITVIYISHLLDDIFAIGDVVTVLRDGKVVGTEKVTSIDRETLVRMMIGRITVDRYVPRIVDEQEKLLEVRNIATRRIRNVSFHLFKGEVLGFYGLRGSGKTEIAAALFGVDQVLKGEIWVKGKKVNFTSPRDAIRCGITMVPEERLVEGLVMKLPVRSNISLTNLKAVSRFGIIRNFAEKNVARRYSQLMDIKTRSIEQRVATLSGGNQQKVVIAKCLHAGSDILLLDEPTRGIDVGAKEEIYKFIRNLAESGKSIVVFSSEYDEVFRLCDRVYLLRDRVIVKELRNREADPEVVLHFITLGRGSAF